MAVSQNGYSANDRSVITTYTVTRAGRRMALRKGPAGEMLADFFRWFDENIRDIDPGILDDWGYAERPIRGSTTELSNHASGTAGDVDATKWPLGVTPEVYLTAAEIDAVDAKLREYEGCIRWGANYTGRKDPMHFEIDRDEATVARVWEKIKAARARPASPDEEDFLSAIKYAVVFASPAEGLPEDIGIWECSMLNGTRVRLPDMQTVSDRKHWLTKCGIPWHDAGEVGRINAFGVDITPA